MYKMKCFLWILAHLIWSQRVKGSGNKSNIVPLCHKSVESCISIPKDTDCFGFLLPYSESSLSHFTQNSEPQVSYPSLVNRELSKWSPLKSVPRCWNAIRPLLCIIYYPPCTSSSIPLVSHHLCKVLRGPCRIIPSLYDGDWPSLLQCNRSELFVSGCSMNLKYKFPSEDSVCLFPLVKSKSFHYEDIDDCALTCESPLYSPEDYSKIRSFVKIGASVTLFFSLLAISTFLIDWKGSRRYPNLIILNMNLCVSLVLFGFLSQFMGSRPEDIFCRSDQTLRVLEPGSGENFTCALVFFLVYYFGSAFLLWFVILTYSWSVMFARMGKQIPTSNAEVLQKKSSIFHILAWSLPLIQSIAAIFMNSIEGNVISGICFVTPNLTNMSLFVLIPLSIVLLLSSFFLTKSLLSLLSLNQKAHGGGLRSGASSKIKITVFKIAIYSTFILLNVVLSFLHSIYYFKNDEIWRVALRNYIHCRTKGYFSSEFETKVCQLSHSPQILWIQLDLFIFFLSGLLTSLWTWTKNSVKSWKTFLRRKVFKEDKEVDSSKKTPRFVKHKLIRQAFAKRNEYANDGRLSLTFQSSIHDPLALTLENSSNSSGDFSSAWAAALPRLIVRRGALTGPFLSLRRDSSESTASKATNISIKSQRFSWGSESRRHSETSNELTSTDLERLRSIYESTIQKKSKRKMISHRLRRIGSHLSSRRASLSSNDRSSNNSTILPAITLDPMNSVTTTMTTKKNQRPPISFKRKSSRRSLGGAHVEYLELEDKLRNLSTSRNIIPNDDLTNITHLNDDDDDEEENEKDEKEENKKTSIGIQTSPISVKKCEIGIQVASNFSCSPLQHVEPNVIQIRVDNNSTSEDSSLPSSFDFESLLKRSKGLDNKENKVSNNASELRPLHNRGRRGAIIESTSLSESPDKYFSNLKRISSLDTSSTST